MKTYTLKEVSKKINVTPGMVRQWEKEFVEILDIPRSKQGARIFTDLVIDQLLEIKQLTDKKGSKEMINQSIQNGPDPESVKISPTSDVSVEIITGKL